MTPFVFYVSASFREGSLLNGRRILSREERTLILTLNSAHIFCEVCFVNLFVGIT